MQTQLGIPGTLWVYKRLEQFKVKEKLRAGRKGSSSGSPKRQ
jgi:adenylosuccinate lyase